MVFAVNAVESGPNNFEAFQALAKQLNGTSTTSSASPSASDANAAMSLSVNRGAGVVVSIVALLFGLML